MRANSGQIFELGYKTSCTVYKNIEKKNSTKFHIVNHIVNGNIVLFKTQEIVTDLALSRRPPASSTDEHPNKVKEKILEFGHANAKNKEAEISDINRLLFDMLDPEEQTMNKEYYLALLKRLHKKTVINGWILHDGNVI